MSTDTNAAKGNSDWPSEGEIKCRWQAGELPVVSVICITFNHHNYIEQALGGVLRQKTSFRFEVIIHDDASTDGTTEIVKACACRYPEIVRVIAQHENQYSQGVRIAPLALAQARGQYIALCEGDDYWVAPNKLQSQVELLARHPAVDLCWHECSALDQRSGKHTRYSAHRLDTGPVPLSAIIENDGGFIPTPALLMRKTAIETMPEWFYRDAPISDFFFQIYSARRGGGLYIARRMAVHRRHHAESWTHQTWQHVERRLAFERAFHRSVLAAEADFPRHGRYFTRLIFRHYIRLAAFGYRCRSVALVACANEAITRRTADLTRLQRAAARLMFTRLGLTFLR